jgi:hypothetical protein
MEDGLIEVSPYRDALRFLQRLFADGEPRNSTDVKAAAKAARINQRDLLNAENALKFRRVADGHRYNNGTRRSRWHPPATL